MNTEGQRAKTAGIAVATLHADTLYRIRFNNRLAELADSGESFTSEDVTRVAGIPNDKIVGALMNAAATQGHIRRLAYVPAGRVNQHAAMISRWVGTGKQIQRVLLAEDEPRGARWICHTCEQPASLDPTPSLDPRIGVGKCFVCQKPSAFRRV